MVSIIIPTYNEEKIITALQENLAKLKGEYEIIFADSGDDKTFELIKTNYKIKKIKSEKGRAKQMNAGAKLAVGDYLWFLHADSEVNPESILAIENSNAEVGCFKLRFVEKDFRLKVISILTNIRGRICNLAFGDRGVFIKRELFFEMQCFTEIPLMEDYDFSIRLNKKNKKIKVLNLFITTSGRRFKKNGVIKTILLMQKLQHDFVHGKSIDKIAERYEK